MVAAKGHCRNAVTTIKRANSVVNSPMGRIKIRAYVLLKYRYRPSPLWYVTDTHVARGGRAKAEGVTSRGVCTGSIPGRIIGLARARPGRATASLNLGD
ncbi:hypothetical protein EVAR_27226_1 [Eumeta japonica]|uniref:Uncharacterized protein n=1 Tax=Eumeta variegata TaxID=151549 RepID=A0A4C1VVU7_EUMVA|nr:hypothetical protein EVAR_27226_1 [Eumeta japonica]